MPRVNLEARAPKFPKIMITSDKRRVPSKMCRAENAGGGRLDDVV